MTFFRSRIAVFGLFLALPAFCNAASVTIAFEGFVSGVDAVLEGGPFAVGQVVSGSYTYELDPALNPDINPSTGVGQYSILSWSGIFLDGQPLTLTPASFGIVIFEGGVDGWDAANRLSGISIGSYDIDSFGISLRDTSDSAFTDDGLVIPPPLPAFDIDQSLFLFTSGSNLAQVDVTMTRHEAVPVPAALPLLLTALASLGLWRRH